MNEFRYFMPSEVVFQPHGFDALAKRCAPLGKAPLVVTGRHSARRTGLLERIDAQFPGAAVFDAVEENPATQTCERGAEFCRERGCDYVIALGGGSPIDAAKAIAVLARNPGRCRDYFGANKYPEPNLPIVAVPTTAGTGSEVTPYAVIVDSEANSKRTISGKSLFPVLAFLDPALTLSLPREVTVNTGLDALSQAMEGLVSRTSTPVGDALALDACRRIRKWLPHCAQDGGDLEARGEMLYASMLAGCVIAQAGTTLVHGMGYYYTVKFGVAHGRANALLLTPLFQHNARHETAKVAAIAEILGRPAPPEPDAVARNIALGIHGILSELGVSPAARDAGVPQTPLAGYAEEVAADPYRFRNQPGELEPDDLKRFYQQSYDGVIA
ncbi:MAG: iron-containing alcohol dehydrogenase [FCB group bacterium]|nr:iron-containing alcohol dehydrogenase [FCB group bacterium]